MKISLLYNESAGGGFGVKKVRRAIERAGHEVVRAVGKKSRFRKVREDPGDLVVVAGGDGTVRRAVLVMAGRRVPLAILPLGTANNLAKALGVYGPIDAVVARWSSARRAPLDVGVARGPWGERRFLEALGTGLLPHAIAAMDGRPAPRDPDAALEQAARVYRRALDHLRPEPLTIVTDGAPASGEFLLVEVLNIRSVGANVRLVPRNPGHGTLEVVTALEAHRQQLGRYLWPSEGEPAAPELPSRAGRQVEIRGWRHLHIDGKLRASYTPQTVAIGVEPGAIEFLV